MLVSTIQNFILISECRLVALKLGNILLISSTTSFTIIFTAILSPIFLGEKFRWKIDGVTITMLAIGSSIAVAQQPSKILSMNDTDSVKFATDHLLKKSTLILLTFMVVVILIKMKVRSKIQAELDKFYANTI